MIHLSTSNKLARVFGGVGHRKSTGDVVKGLPPEVPAYEKVHVRDRRPPPAPGLRRSAGLMSRRRLPLDSPGRAVRLVL